MLKLQDIQRIYKSEESSSTSYYIDFGDENKIHLTKRRTIIALLVLIHFGEGTEADLAKGSTSIPKIKEILEGKIPDNFIQDFYGDANKPYSELWNEEGFTFIDNLKGGRNQKSQKYVLHIEDHEKLFSIAKKAFRKAPTTLEKEIIRVKQRCKCNFCGAEIRVKEKIEPSTYAKDRRREVFDHRQPIEKGGDSTLENYQGLCFYCNKSKWQICNICTFEYCDKNCGLRYPEKSTIISPTKELIADLLASRTLFNDD